VYTAEHLQQLRDELKTLNRKYEELLTGFVGRSYSSAGAQEHASQGFARRVKILKRSIENVFAILPPERADVPVRDEVSDATINIHAFLFNVFGSLDNLAWVWVQERGVCTPKGKPVPHSQVGLGPKCEIVRASFSVEFRDYLAGMDRWFQAWRTFAMRWPIEFHCISHRSRSIH
jgi:hypothetical protein